MQREERLPDVVCACVGGGSNAIGIFYAFLQDADVRLVGVEAGGEGIKPGRHAARFQGGKLGVLQGSKSYLLQNADGQIELTHSVSAGLDYAAVGPEHCQLRDIGRAEYTYATDDEALNAFATLGKVEGILPALETAHGVAFAMKEAPKLKKDQIILVNLSVTGYTISGSASGNYSLAQPTGLTVNITAKGLTISGASATSRAYNGTTNVVVSGGSLQGLESGDTSNVTLGGSPTGTVASAVVGSNKVVTVTGYTISGSASGNYSLAQPTGVTVDITKAVPTVSAAPSISVLNFMQVNIATRKSMHYGIAFIS